MPLATGTRRAPLSPQVTSQIGGVRHVTILVSRNANRHGNHLSCHTTPCHVTPKVVTVTVPSRDTKIVT